MKVYENYSDFVRSKFPLWDYNIKKEKPPGKFRYEGYKCASRNRYTKYPNNLQSKAAECPWQKVKSQNGHGWASYAITAIILICEHTIVNILNVLNI